MPIDDENLDAAYHKMVAAWEGDTETWRRLTRALRDAIVDHARRGVPYYRETVPPAGAFHDIPLLTKDTIRERLADLLADGVPHHRRFADSSSGSSGQPLRFFRDTSQGVLENISSDRFFRRLWGVPLDVHTVRLTGRLNVPAHERSERASRLRPRRRGGPRFRTVPNIHLTRDRLPGELAAWGTMQPYLLIAYPSMLQSICDEVEDRGMEVPAAPVAVVAVSETLAPDVRARAERVFRCPVHARYGSNEMPRLAGTLPRTGRYVFNPLLAHLEILEEDGTPTPPGEVGRIVLTDLNNYVMPFIRYDTGDLARVSRDGYVGGFPLVDEIMGRSTEVIRLPAGRLVSVMTLHNILFKLHDFQPHVDRYQCAQTALNELELRVVWRHHPTDGLRAAVASALRSRLGSDTVVRVKDVPELGRLPSGKGWVVRQEL